MSAIEEGLPNLKGKTDCLGLVDLFWIRKLLETRQTLYLELWPSYNTELMRIIFSDNEQQWNNLAMAKIASSEERN